MLKTKWIVMSVIFLSVFSMKSHAQMYGSMYGSGMTMGAGACPYQVDVGEAAESMLDDIKKAQDDLKEMQENLTKAKRDLSSKKTELSRSKSEFSRSGYQEGGKVFSFVSHHIEASTACSNYQPGSPKVCPQEPEAPPAPPKKGKKGSKASETAAAEKPAAPACDPNERTAPQTDPSPFSSEQAAKFCKSGGELGPELCTQGVDDTRGYKKDDKACGDALGHWQKSYKEWKDLESQTKSMAESIKAQKKLIADMMKDTKTAIRDHQEEARSSGDTEGGICVQCMLAGNGAVYRKPTGAETLGQVALGIGAMYFGGQLQQQVSNNNAQLGFASQAMPTIGYGFPYFMGALYGALGGGVASGGFGCGAGISGGGYPNGPYGMMGPFGLAGGYGPQGGAFGYPQGMYPSPMGGGMFMPGMSPFGMAGPWGLDGGMGMGGMGGMNPYAGMGMGGMPGMGMGGMGGMNPMGMGMMNPYGMMNPMAMNPYGGMGGMGGMGLGMPNMGMGMGMNPYAGMGGMGGMGLGMPNMGMGMGMNPYGGMGGMNPYSMMNPMMGGMMNPYGMQNPMMGGMYSPYGGGMNPYGMGGMNPMGNSMAMQMQMQQMQMQMQQAQMYQQQQQRAQQNYMAGQQVISGLTSQMNQIMMQIQQVQMSMYSGGSMGYYMGPQQQYTTTGVTGTGGVNQPYAPGVNTTPATSGNQSIR